MEHAAVRPASDREGVILPLHEHVQLYQHGTELATPKYGPQDDLGGSTGRGGAT